VEEKIIKSLIELYRQKGLDVTALVNDPVFNTLSFDIRVSMVKKYADELAKDSSSVVSKNDVKNFIKEVLIGGGIGAGAGLIGGYQALHTLDSAYTGPMQMKKVLGASKHVAVAGAALGAVSAGLRTFRNIQSRKSLHEQSLKLRDDPSDENAIKLISLRFMQPAGFAKPDFIGNMYDKYNNKYINKVTNSQLIAGKRVLDELPNQPINDTPEANATRKRFLDFNE
jgi:hypothetical protein